MILDLIKRLLYLVYPRLCPLCTLPLEREEVSVCLPCLSLLPIYHAEATAAHERLEGVAYFGKLYAALSYHKGGCTQRLMHQYKYRGRTEIADLLADLLAKAHPDWEGGYDYLLAVPMTRTRLSERGYNQALLLAKALASILGGRASDEHIIRPVEGVKQSALDKYERLGNATGTFALNAHTSHELIGARLLIVDDILTSGATAIAMLDALAPLNPTQVDVCVGCVAE